MTSSILTLTHSLSCSSGHVISLLNTRWHQCTLLHPELRQRKQQREFQWMNAVQQVVLSYLWPERAQPVWPVDFLWPPVCSQYSPEMKWTPSSRMRWNWKSSMAFRTLLGCLVLVFELSWGANRASLISCLNSLTVAWNSSQHWEASVT